MNRDRIYLAKPNVDSQEMNSLKAVLDSGWIAPVGPALDSFEKKIEHYYLNKRVLALNSGTSALHLALILAGVSDGDHVAVGTLTFAACANAVLYERAIPVFIDSEERTWNLNPELLRDYLSKAELKPKAIIVTHLYGMPADIEAIASIADEYGITLIEDAAEAMGSSYNGKAVGQFGNYGVLSFNGNKIITSGGGGALILDETEYEHGLHLATQANSGINEYEHDEAGYNYRLSNVLAGVGLGQIEKLNKFVKTKREIYNRYKSELDEFLNFTSEENGCFSNRWLSVALLKNDQSPLELITHLESCNIEARRMWKPLHMHNAYKEAPFFSTEVSENLFQRGICLPSGTGLTLDEQQYVIKEIKSFFKH